MISENLPALMVVTPLLGALATPLLGRGGRAWWIAMGISLATLGISAELLRRVTGAPGEPISYPMGSWAAPYGIEYRIDALNAFVLVLLSGIGTVVTLHARVSVPREIPADRLHYFYAVWLLCQTGLLGMTVTGDAFNVYVLLEISSLATYTLVAMGKDRDRRALSATMNYVVMGTIGASFILLGIGYLYMVTGTLNMQDMAQRLGEIFASWEPGGDAPYRRTVLTGFALLVVGFCIKLALFPLHGWLPDAYTYAPSSVSALLAATATKVGAYVALRFLYGILGSGFSFHGGLPTTVLILSSAGLAVLVGSWLAIRQDDVKRLLAFSSVAQIGYIALGIALANADGLSGAVVHLFNHAVSKGGMFLAVGAVVFATGATHISGFRGLGRRMPWTAAALVVGGLGLVGIPLTAGFVSKWYLVTGALEAGRPEVVAVVLVGSVLAVVYVGRLVEVMYFREPEGATAEAREAPLGLLVPTWILVGASVWFGIDARWTAGVAQQAARLLLEGSP